jgi:serine/threonine-protein kinase
MPSREAWVGRVLGGRYELRALIGHGGSGVVYEAVDRLLNRTVAAKLLRAELDAGTAARVRREARAVARLAHPGIVAVHDVGQAEGRPYLVMEFVAGRALAAELASQGRLAAREAVQIAVALADALGHAHERDVAHRDVSPANVVLTPEGAVKLLDFGVAREAGDAEPPSWATLAYAAPEQRRGEPSGPGADVFAVGVILVEMLTGHPSSDPDPDAVPRVLRSVVSRCLQPRPGHRFIDGRPLAEALRAAFPVLGDTQPVSVAATVPRGPVFPAETWPLGNTRVPTPTTPV